MENIESRKPKTSAAQLRANAKYAEKFKRINCRIPKDLYTKVESTGESANSLILKALEAYLATYTTHSGPE